MNVNHSSWRIFINIMDQIICANCGEILDDDCKVIYDEENDEDLYFCPEGWCEAVYFDGF